VVGLRAGAAVLLAAGLLMGGPITAGAHAELVLSSPVDGATLGVTPGSVLLYFSEQLNPTLSNATVVDPAGVAVSGGPSSALAIQVDLLSNLPGTYRVTWFAVSLVDGHQTQGAFTFNVGSRNLAVTTGSGGLSLDDGIISVARFIEDLALILAVGAVFILWLSRRAEELTWVRPPLVLIFGVTLASGVVVVAGDALTAAGPHPGALVSYFTTSLSGTARAVRLLLEAFACLVVSRQGYRVWPVLAGIVVALAVSGHAAGSGLGVALDTGHVVTAGIWVGGIMTLATLHPPGGWREGGTALLTRFTPWALSAFCATVALGTGQGILNVGTVSALFATSYGRVLVAKSLGILLLIPLSFIAWRRRSTHLRVEAALGATVVLAASLLAAFPLPTDIAASPGAVNLTAEVGLPHGAELTLGAQAGQTLVGVTVSPARPGNNELTLYILSGDGAAASGGLAVNATVDGKRVVLQGCGDTCRRGPVHLTGSDAVSIHVGGTEGGTAALSLPALPAPDGTALLKTALARMSAIKSLTMHETLTGGSGDPTFVTDYKEVAPNRLQWTQPGGASAIAVGSAFTARQGSDQPWVAQPGHDAVPEPSFSWQFFPAPTAVHIVGSTSLDGVPVTVVDCFAGQPGTPVWFRFSIDSGDRVMLSVMSAPGHFMTQSFANFDTPISITLP
jgi:copper transport protein